MVGLEVLINGLRPNLQLAFFAQKWFDVAFLILADCYP
jgi:hypothetical protein